MKSKPEQSLWKTSRQHGLRRLIDGILHEGSRKPLLHVSAEIDITELRIRLADAKRQSEAPSLTACAIHAFGHSLDAHKTFNSYRRGNHVITFEEVDVAVMVERLVDGEHIPLPAIIRQVPQLTLFEIHQRLRHFRSAPVESFFPSRNRWLFEKAPEFLRQIFWWKWRTDPRFLKRYSGTAAVTSLGMHSGVPAFVQTISPMTATLAVGTCFPRLVREEDQVRQAEVLAVTLTVDHQLIDGAPVMRFLEDFRGRFSGIRDFG